MNGGAAPHLLPANPAILRPDRSRFDADNGADEVDLWRGRYIAEFALTETVVSDALARLADLASENGRTLLPHLVGQRFEALRDVVAANGPLAHIGSRVAKSLQDLAEHQRRRNFICHGASEIVPDDEGRWQLVLRMVTFRSAKVERMAMIIRSSEAAGMLLDLHRARIRLDGQFRGMLAALRF